jgi:hypothetical protein
MAMFPMTNTLTRAFEVAPALIASFEPTDSDLFLVLVAIVGVAIGRNKVIALKNYSLEGRLSKSALKTYIVRSVRFIDTTNLQVQLRVDPKTYNCRWETLNMHANGTTLLMLSRSGDKVFDKSNTIPIDFAPSEEDKAAVREFLNVLHRGNTLGPSDGGAPSEAATALVAMCAQPQIAVTEAVPSEEVISSEEIDRSLENNKRARDEQAANIIWDTLKATYGFKPSVQQVLHGFLDACTKNHVDRMELIGALREVYPSLEITKRPKTRDEIVSFLRASESFDEIKQTLWDDLFTAEDKGALALAFIAQKLH